jgi:hypothetical protein
MAAAYRAISTVAATAVAAHRRVVMAREITETARSTETETGSAIAVAIAVGIGSGPVESVTTGGNANGLGNETAISGQVVAAGQTVDWKTRYYGVSERLL